MIWKDINGYDGRYRVSTCGKVERVGGRYEGEMTQQVDSRGYCDVYLTCPYTGKRSTKKVHRLVAEAYLPNDSNLPIVNHIDNNPSNNRIDNLEWCTQLENIQHSVRQGRNRSHVGEFNNRAKLSEKEVLEIYNYNLTDGENNVSIANRFGISRQTVSKIRHGHIRSTGNPKRDNP